MSFYLPHNIELWIQTLVWAPFPVWRSWTREIIKFFLLDMLLMSFQATHPGDGYGFPKRLQMKSTPNQGAAANRQFFPTQILNVNTQFTY